MWETADGETAAFLVDNLHLRDVNPLNCGWHRREPGKWFGPGVRDHTIFHYVLSGKGTYTCGGQTYPVESGELFLIRPDTLVYYEADKANPWTYVWIGFEGEAAERMLDLSGFRKNRLTASLPELNDTFSSLARQDPAVPLPAVRLCGVLYDVFTHLQQRQAPPAPASMPELYVRRSMEYIRANYSQPLTVGEIARLMGIDRRYFSRIFTQIAGTSPQAYLVGYRLDRAAALLADQCCTVGEAAKSVGYADAFTFSRMYKRRFGVSPSETLAGRSAPAGPADGNPR